MNPLHLTRCHICHTPYRQRLRQVVGDAAAVGHSLTWPAIRLIIRAFLTEVARQFTWWFVCSFILGTILCRNYYVLDLLHLYAVDFFPSYEFVKYETYTWSWSK